MASENKSREDTIALFKKYNQTESLYHHALAVEAVMRHYARKYGEDELYWGNVGLLHDIDYEQWPDEHLLVAPRLLEEGGFDGGTVHAVLSHGWGICCDVEPLLPMEKVLFTTDELTGLISATALMRPSRSLMDLELKSVKKKYKNKQFAAGVNRSIIESGCEMMDVPLDDVIQDVILAMRTVAADIDLAGSTETEETQ